MAEKQDQRETGSGHESTWGATTEAKQTWQEKKGKSETQSSEPSTNREPRR